MISCEGYAVWTWDVELRRWGDVMWEKCRSDTDQAKIVVGYMELVPSHYAGCAEAELVKRYGRDLLASGLSETDLAELAGRTTSRPDGPPFDIEDLMMMKVTISGCTGWIDYTDSGNLAMMNGDLAEFFGDAEIAGEILEYWLENVE